MRRPGWCPAFLVALEACDGKIKPAADFAGVARRTVYHRMEVDPTFASDVAAARDRAESGLLRGVRAATAS